MALVSGGRSTLNPNAPLFIPAAVQQVEDFSPEWWNLVTTATWFRDYWLSEHHGEDMFGEDDNGDDVIGLLPDTIGVDEDILNMEAQYEEFLQSAEAHHHRGFGKNAGVLVKNMNFPRERGPISPTNYWEKPAKIVSPKCGPRFIQQPR